MLEIARLYRGSDRFELGFLKREATPAPARKLGIDWFWLDYPFRTQSLFTIGWVSSAVDRPFITGCRRHIYSRSVVLTRITSQLT